MALHVHNSDDESGKIAVQRLKRCGKFPSLHSKKAF